MPVGVSHYEGDLHLNVKRFRLAYKGWKPAADRDWNGRRVLMYPGWLDNSGSFDNLAPLIAEQGYHVVAVDPPGCGLSEHLAPCLLHSDYEEVGLLPDIVETLEWTDRKVTLLGHSRGGGIVYAGGASFPKYFDVVVVLDNKLLALTGLVPGWTKPHAGGHIRESTEVDDRNRVRPPRRFATLEEAVQHSLGQKTFPKARTTAENIVKRHLRYEPETADWVFTHDVRTYGQKQRVHLTKEQSDSFARSLKLPLLMVTAQKGSFSWQKSKAGKEIMLGVEGRKRLIADFTEIVSADHFHHMHSDDAPYTASLVLPWLLEKHRPASKL